MASLRLVVVFCSSPSPFSSVGLALSCATSPYSSVGTDTSLGLPPHGPILPLSVYHNPRHSATQGDIEIGAKNMDDCKTGQTTVSLILHIAEEADKCGYSLREKGSEEEHTVSSLPGGVSTTVFCLDPGVYELTLTKTTASGWGTSLAEMRLEDGTLALRASLPAGTTEKAFPVNLLFSLPPAISQWHYSFTPQPSSLWLQQYASWEQAFPHAFPPTISLTQYFATSFSIYTLTAYSALRLGAVVYAGAVFYLNGVEVHRVHMPAGAVAGDTLATNSFQQPTWCFVSVSLLHGAVRTGENVLAVELHAHNRFETGVSFDASALLLLDDSLMLRNGVGIVSTGTTGTTGTTGIATPAFDDNPATVFTADTCAGVELTWAFSNHFEVITQYTLRPTACPGNMPSAWVIEAANATQVWTLLQIKSDERFAGAERSFSFYNTQPFSHYRLRVTACQFAVASASCPADALRLADLLFFSRLHAPYCHMPEFPPALLGETALLACPAFSTGLRSARCRADGFATAINDCSPLPPRHFLYPQTDFVFHLNEPVEPIEPAVEAWYYFVTITPALPAGLALSSTGVISGTPLKTAETTRFTLELRNGAGLTQTQITITVKWSWRAVLVKLGRFALAAVIVVVGVVIIRFLRSRSLQHRRTLERREESVSCVC